MIEKSENNESEIEGLLWAKGSKMIEELWKPFFAGEEALTAATNGLHNVKKCQKTCQFLATLGTLTSGYGEKPDLQRTGSACQNRKV